MKRIITTAAALAVIAAASILYARVGPRVYPGQHLNDKGSGLLCDADCDTGFDSPSDDVFNFHTEGQARFAIEATGFDFVASSGGIGIGHDVTTDGDAVVIGNDASATGTSAIAIGYGVNCPANGVCLRGDSTSTNAIVINGSVGDYSGYGISIGSQSSVSGSTSPLAIGYDADVTSAARGIAIGSNADITTGGTDGIAIGTNAKVVGVVSPGASIAIGTGADVSAGVSGAIALGYSTDSGHDYGIAIGRGAATTAANQIVIGSSSYNHNMVLFGAMQPIAVTADPCGSLTEGSLFYNTTGNYMCYCDGTNDVQMHDPGTACF